MLTRLWDSAAAILLQIVMVHPGTHLVKNPKHVQVKAH